MDPGDGEVLVGSTTTTSVPDLTALFDALPAGVAYLRGPDLVFEYANAAYLALVRSREILGKPLAEALPEVATQRYAGLLQAVLTTGTPCSEREAPVLLERDGGLQQTYFDFTYQAVPGGNGRPAGVLAQVIEVTDKVEARQSVEDVAHQLRRAEQRYRALYEGSADVVLVTDGDGRYVDVNARATEVLGYTRDELLAMTVADLVADTEEWTEREWSTFVGAGWWQGSATLRHRDGSTVEMDVVATTVDLDTGDVVNVASLHDVTARRAAEEALQRSEQRHRTLFQTMAQGVVYQDAAGVLVDANPAAVRILGRSLDDLRGLTSVDPDWQARREDGTPFPGEEHPPMVALRTGQPVRNVLMQVFSPRLGERRWILVGATPQPNGDDGSPSGVFSSFEDVTDLKRMEEALREGNRLLARLRDSNIVGVVVADPDRVLEANDAFLDMVGHTQADLDAGRVSWRDLTPPEHLPADERAIDQLLSTGAAEPYEKAYRRADGTLVPVLIGAALLQRDPPRWVCLVVDLAEQKRGESERERLLEAERAARDDAEKLSRKLRALLASSEVLAESIHYPEALDQLARLMVFELADLCVIDVLQPSGALHRVSGRHRDPDAQRLVDRLRDEFPPVPGTADPVARVVQAQRAEWAAEVGDDLLRAISRDAEQLEVLRQLGASSYISVPLVARGQSLGALTVVRTHGSPPYGDEDVALVGEIARRAGVRLLNSRLFDERDHAARTLQRRLLPSSLPSIPGIELAAHHVASGEGNEVGGDFYDAFPLDGDRWLIVVGDVCGKGPAAGAMTGMARHTLRGLARHQTDPGLLLKELNAALVADNPDDRFCTMCVVRLDHHEGGTQAVIANAGHPRPLVVRDDAAVDAVGGFGDLLGVFADMRAATECIELRTGDMLVLYTDGVIERRDQGIDEGERWLRGLIGGLAASPVAEVVTTVEQAALRHRRTGAVDDIAVVAARVTR